MIVISDTSCLCYLARLGHASVLEALFGSVLIPPAVAAELLAGVAEYPEIDSVLQSSWTQVHTLEKTPQPGDFPKEIDAGEAEAIQLAEEMHADHLLIDDAAGRRCALDRGITVVGLLGVLGKARQQGLTGPLRPLFLRLTNELGFRASRLLVETILEAYHE